MYTALDISTSLLPHFVSGEDRILDALPTCRAMSPGQVMGSKIDEAMIVLTRKPVDPMERETVLHAEGWKYLKQKISRKGAVIAGSTILGMYDKGEGESTPPTPLHKIGTWQEPAPLNLSVETRTIDFAIQAFAASFGSQDNVEKEKASILFEKILSLAQQQGSRLSNALMSETEKINVKVKMRIPRMLHRSMCTIEFLTFFSFPCRNKNLQYHPM